LASISSKALAKAPVAFLGRHRCQPIIIGLLSLKPLRALRREELRDLRQYARACLRRRRSSRIPRHRETSARKPAPSYSPAVAPPHPLLDAVRGGRPGGEGGGCFLEEWGQARRGAPQARFANLTSSRSTRRQSRSTWSTAARSTCGPVDAAAATNPTMREKVTSPLLADFEEPELVGLVHSVQRRAPARLVDREAVGLGMKFGRWRNTRIATGVATGQHGVGWCQRWSAPAQRGYFGPEIKTVWNGADLSKPQKVLRGFPDHRPYIRVSLFAILHRQSAGWIWVGCWIVPRRSSITILIN
jgi:hypothetical protein